MFAKTGGWNFNWLQITSGLKSAQLDEVAEAPKSEFSIFPVPAGNVLNINFGSEEATLTVQVTNVSGATLLQTQISNNSTLDVSSLTSGIYVIRVSKNNEVISKLFVKK